MNNPFRVTLAKHRATFGWLLLTSMLGIFSVGCSGGSGTASDSISLPLEDSLDLYCQDEGVHPNACVLDDPENPFSRSIVNGQTKWELSDTSPSAKSSFYIWATALARDPIGENQYYAATALHDLFTQGGSDVAREQAKRAYRSVLENFYDSLTYYDGSPQLDLIPDADFFYSDWGSGTAGAGWDGGYEDDAYYSPVWSVPAGEGWGAPTAAVAFDRFDAGFAGSYQNLVFKAKALPIDTVWITFAGGGSNHEVSFDLISFALDIPDSPGWKQVTIPLAPWFTQLEVYTGFAIHSGWGNGGTFLLTDVRFTGDATGNGLAGDVDGNDGVYLYRSGTQTYSVAMRDLVGRNLHDPQSQNLSQLYLNESEAMGTLAQWGYNYDPAIEKVTRLQ